MVTTIIKFLKSVYSKRRHDNIMRACRNISNIGDNFVLGPDGLVCNESGDPLRITIGNNCRLNGNITSASKGIVHIGHFSTIQSGVRIRCVNSIQIGSYTGIAQNTILTDNNTHRTDIEGWIEHRIRVAPGGKGYPGLGFGWELSQSAPIVIGDGVWIGGNSLIMKGVTIGDGAIVASCSVVVKDVEPFTIVAGNPAKKVKQLPIPDLSVIELAQRIIDRTN